MDKWFTARATRVIRQGWAPPPPPAGAATLWWVPPGSGVDALSAKPAIE